MIKVVAKQFVKAGKLEEFLPVAKTLVEETNKKDAGCIKYEMYQDLSNPLIVTVIEEWESDAALDAHMKSKHFTELIPTIGGFCEKQADINLYKLLF
jgi:quinol monooxygenase YgiN